MIPNGFCPDVNLPQTPCGYEFLPERQVTSLLRLDSALLRSRDLTTPLTDIFQETTCLVSKDGLLSSVKLLSNATSLKKLSKFLNKKDALRKGIISQ